MTESELMKYLTLVEIKINDEIFYLEMGEVKEIQVPEMAIIPIPLAERHIVGIIDVRGDIYTIVSLTHILHPDYTDQFKISEDSRIVLLEYKALNLGFLVDSVESIKKLPNTIFESQSSIIKTEIDWKFIKYIGMEENQTCIVLDLEAIFTKLGEIHEEMEAPRAMKERFVPTPLPKIEPQGPQIVADIDLTKTTSKKTPTQVKAASTSSIKPAKVEIPSEEGYIKLTKIQQDALKEIGNIGSGNAITALSRLINKRIDVDLTDVGIISFQDLHKQFGGKNEVVCGIFSHIKQPSQSTILQVFDSTPLMKLVKDLAGKESKIDPNKVKQKKDLDEFAISTVVEVGNILAGHYASSLADLMEQRISIEVPEFTMSKAGELSDFLAQEVSALSEYVVLIKTEMRVVDLQLRGYFFFIPDIDSLDNLFKSLGIEDELVIAAKPLPEQSIILTEQQKDALQEVGNIGAGNAANALAKMINKRVDINIPAVEMVELDTYADNISKKNLKLFVAWSNVTGKTRSTVLSIFKVSDILRLAGIMVEGGDAHKLKVSDINSITDFPELERSAIGELGHILASHYTTALGDLLGIRLMTEPPDMSIDLGRQLFNILKEEIGILKKLSLVITTAVIIKDIKVTGTFLFIPELETLEHLLEALTQFL
ncbi:MAG: chemotaxis protein CheC [Candidatus Lokiarchaeota archaeon]|nr:chemotaxis protein CheC [Candidatus Lokiarchaeota archaeon]